MEPQLQHPQVHRYGEDHHHRNLTGLEGQTPDEQHDENTSILKKVKVKAKKIKESIKKHGHLHGHEHHHDEEENEDEYKYETDEDDLNTPAHFATNQMGGGQMLDNFSSGDDQTTSNKDHIGHEVLPHGLGAEGFTGAGNIGRLIIPEEAPLATRNTPVSQHGQGHQPISHSEDVRKQTPPADHEEGLTQRKQSSYTGKITSVLADKASEAKNVVASKLGGTQSTNWTEKLRPGDEDKALSDLISGALCKKTQTIKPEAAKGKEGKSSMKETVSDAVHKRASENDSHNVKEVKLMGKVTESEEVARRLGTSEEERRGEVTHVPTGIEIPVMDWVKATVSSWWTDGNQHPDNHSKSDAGPQEHAK